MPVPIYRLLSLLCTPYLILVMAMVLIGDRSRIEPTQAFAMVIGGATIVCVLLAMLSVRFVDKKEEDRRFSISTLMICTSILAVYLAFFRQLAARMPRSDQFEFDSAFWLVIQFLLFSIVVTITLAVFTETILSIAVRCRRAVIELLKQTRESEY